MKTNLKLTLAAIVAGCLLAGGAVALYRLGVAHGGMAPHGAAPAASSAGAVLQDPSSWGVPEGMAATQRHIDSGLKAGQVDPVTGRKILYYHDPMVPGKNFDAPGKSPFMDMMLVPQYAGSDSEDASGIAVSARMQQNLGLRTALVSESSSTASVLAVGAVSWNERDQVAVQARAMGYVEKLHVTARLDRVSKGQALMDVYVPDWVAVQEDYLAVQRITSSASDGLREAALQRMRQLGMDAEQIGRVQNSQAVQARFTVRAPMGGVLTELAVREGMSVATGSLLARINGTRTVWVNAQVPESQAALLQNGAQIVATSPALPDRTLRGRIQALLPEVNAQTRTLLARVEIDNPDSALMPGMFVTMSLAGKAAGQGLRIPSEALIYTGKRSLVMLADEDGRFHPQEVIAGVESEGLTEIKKGLSAGQRVVLSGQFLLESEASLKGLVARMSAPAPVADKHDAHADHRHSMAASSPQTYHTRARLEAQRQNALSLTHPAIPELKWPGMTMDFSVAPGLKLPALKAGQELDIEFRTPEGEIPQIIALRPAASGSKK